MEVDNSTKYFSDFEIDFIDRFITHLSHCSSVSDGIDILKDNQLKAKKFSNEANDDNRDRSMHDKVFCRIDDVYVRHDNIYCGSSFGVEYQLNKWLITKYKYYIIHEPQKFGGLQDAIYISPYLFDILKKSDFDKNKFKKNIKNENIEDKMITYVLLDELDALFDSKVVQEKYNPPITSSLIHAIEIKKKEKNDQGYGLTIAFLGHIDLTPYLNEIIISSEIDSPVWHKYFINFIDDLKKRNIPYRLKKFNN
jgi:hypothetical protein